MILAKTGEGGGSNLSSCRLFHLSQPRSVNRDTDLLLRPPPSSPLSPTCNNLHPSISPSPFRLLFLLSRFFFSLFTAFLPPLLQVLFLSIIYSIHSREDHQIILLHRCLSFSRFRFGRKLIRLVVSFFHPFFSRELRRVLGSLKWK